MDVEFIKSKIPHRPPMLLVDSVTELERERIVCRKTFREDEFFHRGHYPGNPMIPGFLLCEAAAQSAAVLAACRESIAGVPLLTRANDVKFKQRVCPGETVDIEVVLDEQLAGALYFSAKIRKASQLAASLSLAVMIQRD